MAAVFVLPVEFALYIADTGVAFGEEAALQLLSAFGGLFIALFALSPKAGAAGRTRLAEQRAAALRRCGLERAAPPTLRERLACRWPADGASELADGV